jgi:hypothetical protein
MDRQVPAGGPGSVWRYGETQDTAQSHTTDGHSALAEFTAKLTLKGSSFSYSFPAYSMTVLDLGAQNRDIPEISPLLRPSHQMAVLRGSTNVAPSLDPTG